MRVFSQCVLSLALGAGLLSGRGMRAQAEGSVHKSLNQKVVKEASPYLGKRVGNGSCYAFAEQVLKQAGAEPPNRFVWGQKLAAADPIYPGDVIQFTGVRIEQKDGQFYTMAEHTAIVYRVEDGRKVTLIHQNFGNKPSELNVTTTVIDLRDVKKGTVDIYHPRPRGKK